MLLLGFKQNARSLGQHLDLLLTVKTILIILTTLLTTLLMILTLILTMILTLILTLTPRWAETRAGSRAWPPSGRGAGATSAGSTAARGTGSTQGAR